MSWNVRHLVSKKKKRYVQDGFDLDLTYIKPNIVAMGFPAEKLEGVYRNNIDEVVRFLEAKHKDHYKLYNLCSEKTYDESKFQHRVSTFAFDDHNAPPFELIKPFCEDVDKFLGSDKNNVAMIHCKAGKGRTGVMICSYLLHTGYSETTSDSLKFYGNARTQNNKGVTIPSQRRYVEYYGHYIRNRMTYSPVTILLSSFEMSSIPNIYNGSCSPYFTIWQKQVKLFQSQIFEVHKKDKTIRCVLAAPIPVCGDIKVEFFHKEKFSKERMFIFWFNTFFVKSGFTPDKPDGGGEKSVVKSLDDGSDIREFWLSKEDLDKANKDKKHKIYPQEFQVKVQIVVPDARCLEKENLEVDGDLTEEMARRYSNIILPDARCPEKQNREMDDDLTEEMEKSYSNIRLNKKGVPEYDRMSVDINLVEEDLSEDEINEWEGEETDRRTKVVPTASSDMQVTRV